MSGHIVLGLMVAFVWGMVAFAIAIDASRRGRHGGVWGVVTFLTGLFGAILYGLVVLATSDPANGEVSEKKTEPNRVRICPTCSSEVNVFENYCGECGTELSSEDEYLVGRRLKTGSKRYCSNCKSQVGRKANACPNCDAVF